MQGALLQDVTPNERDQSLTGQCCSNSSTCLNAYAQANEIDVRSIDIGFT